MAIRLLGLGTLLAGGAILSACTAGLDWFASTPATSDVASTTAEVPKPAAAPAPSTTSDAASSKAEVPKPAAVPAVPATSVIPDVAASKPEPAKPAAVHAISMEDNCPTTDIRAGAGTLSVTDTTQQPTASDVRYQLTFIKVARQCALNGQTVTMRVGVQGRAVAGPAGAPTQIEVPLRYAVVREGPEPRTIVTKFKRFSVDMPAGAPNNVFTDIEDDLSFPLPPIDELTAYVVYVGFDEIGDRNERRPPAKKGRAK